MRMLASAIKNKEIEKRSSGKESWLSDEEGIAVIRTEIKKRKDATEQFTKGMRQDLAEKEMRECRVLEGYMPQEMADSELEGIVEMAVASLGASSMKDFGRVMGEAMKNIHGRASGDRVSTLVKKKLSGQ